MAGSIREKVASVGQSIHNWNANRWHFPDVHDYKYFKLIATIITRIGFFAKGILYGSMAIIAMIAASGVYDNPEGPQTVLVRLTNELGKVVVGFFVAGLFCYSLFAFLYSVFDFDRLGHHTAFPILARFGRIFSAGFYAFIGYNGVEILINIKNGDSGSTAIGDILFETTAGKAVVCFLGVVFCVVALVYLGYIIRPGKFRRELAGERMPPWLFHTCVTIARIGAVGRVLFFASFGAVLIYAIAHNRGGTVEGTSLIGLQGVLTYLAEFSHVLLFITGAFLFFYAFWAFILCAYRRLPAHYNEAEALAAVGMRWRASKAKRALRHHKLDEPIEMENYAGNLELPETVPIEEIKQENSILETKMTDELISKNDDVVVDIEKIEVIGPSPIPFHTAERPHGSPAGLASH